MLSLFRRETKTHNLKAIIRTVMEMELKEKERTPKIIKPMSSEAADGYQRGTNKAYAFALALLKETLHGLDDKQEVTDGQVKSMFNDLVKNKGPQHIKEMRIYDQSPFAQAFIGALERISAKCCGTFRE